MPYEIIKKGKGYKVQNKNTKKTYSKKPMNKKNVKKQYNLLENKYKKKNKKKLLIKFNS